MSTPEHLVENALVYLLKNEGRKTDFSDNTLILKQCKECNIDPFVLFEMCQYIIYDYGTGVMYQTLHDLKNGIEEDELKSYMEVY